MARKRKPEITQGWALYLRTSTDESQAPERSQESQRRIIQRTFLKNSDLPVIGEYRDIYSGRKTDRADYQRLLEDARQGKFSYVAVAMVDRFGRNNGEIARAVDELIDLGVRIRLANFPDLDVANAGGRLIVNLLAAVAHFESDRNSERTIEGMLTKILDGGWPFRVPDGYRNAEERAGSKDVANSRYRRWVEQDAEQSKVWRRAWDLLLQDQMKLVEICDDLHQRGYKLRSGSSFVKVKDNGQRKYNTGALSRVFHNWFYAGWIVVDNDWANIPPKKIQGKWEPIVSTGEFERGLAILERRNRGRDQKSKNFYLLTSLLYLDDNGSQIRMTGSTPSSSRPGGGTPYYHASGQQSVNIPCQLVDTNLLKQLHSIQIEDALLPAIRDAYTEHLSDHIEEKSDDRTTLSAALKRIDEEEERTARLYATGRISDAVWNTLWVEWNDQRAKLQASIESLGAEKDTHIDNLDAAINLLANIGILYERLAQHKRKFLLKQIVKKIVINLEGMIIKVELHSPFTYLRDLASQCAGNGQGLPLEKDKSSANGLDCSKIASLGVPFGRKHEHPHLIENIIDFTKRTSYPQRARLERLLVIS